MSQFKLNHIQHPTPRSPLKSSLTVAAAVAFGAMLAACTPQDDQAAAGGSAVASDSAQNTMRDTEAQVKAADEKLNKAREEAEQKIPGTTTD